MMIFKNLLGKQDIDEMMMDTVKILSTFTSEMTWMKIDQKRRSVTHGQLTTTAQRHSDCLSTIRFRVVEQIKKKNLRKAKRANN
jgi:hypothetical protein